MKKAAAKKAALAKKRAAAKKAPSKKWTPGGVFLSAYMVCEVHKLRFPRGEGCPRCV